jgi:membrane protease YdiL (CAAX protease family)
VKAYEKGEFLMSKLCKDYLWCTFIIMVVCWGTCVLCGLNGILLKNTSLLYIPYLLGGWSPTIASFIVLKKNNEVKNFKDWLRNVFDFKHNILAYVMVVIFAILYILPQCLISGYENGAPLFAIVVMIPMMLVGGGLEEAGWRYILQPELEKKYTYFIATLIVSIIWCFWHLPLFYIPYRP